MPNKDKRVLKVQCQLCQVPKSTEYKWCGSTSSMLRHLKEQHGHFKEDDEEDIEKNDVNFQFSSKIVIKKFVGLIEKCRILRVFFINQVN